MQVFGDAPGALLKPNVIYAMKQGKVGRGTLFEMHAMICSIAASQSVGPFRNADLHMRQDDEGCAPALQHEDNSNRPFETVEELAKKLGEYEYVLHHMHTKTSWRWCVTCMICRHEPADGR